MKRSLQRDGTTKTLILKSISEVKTWNKRRIRAYKNRMHKTLSYLKTPEKAWDLVFNKNAKYVAEDIEQLEQYIESLKTVLNEKDSA